MQNDDLETKLNKRERYKARLRPYDYFAEFETLDFESLGEGDRFYLQDFGIFNTEFLEDEFTIRLRVAGGKISTETFSFIAHIVNTYKLTLLITARAGLQLHNIEADNVKEIWHKLNTHGLTTWQSFGDNVRNIVTDVFDGVNKYAKIPTYPMIQEMQKYILKNKRYVGMLPRRVSVGISGNSANVNSFFANDIYFALALKDEAYGFNVYMGGKNTKVAKDVNIFLLSSEVLPFFKAFIETFYKYGSRFSRSKTRLVYMIESLGLTEFKTLLLSEYKKEFQSAGVLQFEEGEFESFEELRDGTFAYRYQTNFARLQTDEIAKINAFASTNLLEIRLATDQNIYLLGLKEKKVPFTSPALSSTILTCAGNLCPYTVWSIKDETSYLPLQEIYEQKIKVGFSGCTKGCGRHRHVDIGLIGLKTNNFGAADGGARVFIGAEHDRGKSVARELFAMVPFVHLKSTISLIITLYIKSNYENFQLYSHHILQNYSQEFLSLWYLLNLKTVQTLVLKEQKQVLTQEDEITLIGSSFTEFQLQENSFRKSIHALSQELWKVQGVDAKYKPSTQKRKFR